MSDVMVPHVLREYAFVGDGRRGALIGPSGDMSFLCVPDWHSPAVFSALLGGAGHFTVTPADRHVWGGFYEPDSLIWTSRWITPNSIIHCREALALPGAAEGAVLLRQVRAIEDVAAVEIMLDLRAEFGAEAMRGMHHDDGVWTGRTGDLWWRLTGADQARVRNGMLRWRLQLPAGAQHDLVLEVGTRLAPDRPDPGALWRRTEQAWAVRKPDLTGIVGERDASHAVAVLRGMTHPNGGMAAAATTSLPERAESGRNYDYRYAWIRDQCFAGQAAAAAGIDDLLDSAMRFVTSRLHDDGANLAPAYTIAPTGPVPDEQRLESLSGYPGGPVTVGNHVNAQFQLDMFGEALLLIAAAGRAGRLDSEHVKAAQIAAAAIGTRWTEPDAGVWELDSHRWTHSALTCVAGLHAAAGLVPAPLARDWTSLAEAIEADAGRHGVHPTGRWRRAYDDDRVDAALLMPPMRSARLAADPRSRATLAAIRQELCDDEYVYRFRPDDRPLGEAEGAFLLCGFALARVAAREGDRVTAIRLFERGRTACGPPGIFSEEYDVLQRQMRGNLPQAFVHAMMLETAVALSSK